MRNASPLLLSLAITAWLFSFPCAGRGYGGIWTFFRFGDVDGFGFNGVDGPLLSSGATGLPWNASGPAGAFQAANGGLADTNGNGILEPNEFLPDVNRRGFTQTGDGDDWDNRTLTEIANNDVFFDGEDTIDNGSNGSKWTDITLSTSYGNPIETSDNFLGDFPDVTVAAPNEPTFDFNFSISKLENPDPFPVFFNMVFGDYDVVPATIRLTLSGGDIKTVPISVQPSNQDGLIQAAFSTLSFADVFNDGGATWNADLTVDFIAPNEPYTAFDFVELSRTRIGDQVVPEPGSLAIFGALVLLVGLGTRGRQKQTA